MPTIALVRANAILPCITVLEGIGAPVERLLCESGLSPGCAGDGERLLPLHACLSFLGRAADHESLPALGLVVGRQAPFEQLGGYARLVQHGATLSLVLSHLIGAISLHSTGDVVWLSFSGARSLLCHRFASPGHPAEAITGWIQGEMLSACFMIGAVRAAIGPAWMPDEVWLPAAAAAWRNECEELLRVPVRCSGDFAAVVFPAALLGAPNRACRSPEGEPADYSRLRETSPATDLVGTIGQVIATFLADGYPDIGRTARAVGLSVRTLQRRLSEAGESYSRLVDLARYQACVRMMHVSGAKLIDIAGEVGYADQANFTRAFRRWTGKPPRNFRREAI